MVLNAPRPSHRLRNRLRKGLPYFNRIYKIFNNNYYTYYPTITIFTNTILIVIAIQNSITDSIIITIDWEALLYYSDTEVIKKGNDNNNIQSLFNFNNDKTIVELTVANYPIYPYPYPLPIPPPIIKFNTFI